MRVDYPAGSLYLGSHGGVGGIRDVHQVSQLVIVVFDVDMQRLLVERMVAQIPVLGNDAVDSLES